MNEAILAFRSRTLGQAGRQWLNRISTTAAARLTTRKMLVLPAQKLRYLPPVDAFSFILNKEQHPNSNSDMI